MKKFLIITFSMLVIVFTACKSKPKDTTTGSRETEANQETKPADAPAGQSKTYTVTITPDSLSLGKDKEAFVKLKNAKALELLDPDGKQAGIEFSYELEVTNKNKLGGAGIFINPADFRMLLDNGNSIVHESYNSVSVDPESTKSSAVNVFKIPVGGKPKSLNLFYDQTRTSVTIDLK